jgi:MFS family permease
MIFPEALKTNLNNSFPALRHKNFRYYWFGMIVSLIGTWMQNIGQSWMVYSITNSPFKLGLVGSLQFLPMLVLSLFAGALIDRLPKKKILILTQSLAMILAFVMAALVYTGYIRYWQVLILAILLGLVNTFDMPARQSFMIELVGREHLVNAIALNSTVFNAARIVGPAVAGILMGYLGVAFCFLINGISFIPVIIGLIKIDAAPVIRNRSSKSNILREIKHGLAYIISKKVLYRTILSVTVVSIFAMNFSVLVPVLVKQVLNHGEAGYGFLMSAMGVGSLIGAILTAVKSKVNPLKLILWISPLCVSVLFIAIGFSKLYFITAILLAGAGFFNTCFFTTANSTLQFNSDDEYRGRVISVYTLVFGGTTPIGNFISGSISEGMGAGAGFIICGVVVIIFNLMLLIIRDRNKTAI